MDSRMRTAFFHHVRQQSSTGGVTAGVRPRRQRFRRKGISALWVILTIPVFLILLAVVLNIANLWLARVDLENSLEAAALAAVQEWGRTNGGSTVIPRQVGQAYAAANPVRCCPVNIATNLDPNPDADNPNANLTCCVGKCPPEGNLIFGAINEDDPDLVIFNAGIAGGCTPADVVIDVYEKSDLSPLLPWYFGIFFEDGPPNLSIQSVTITLPELQPDKAYFDGNKSPVVSNGTVAQDILNRFNPDPQPKDVRGLDPDPTVGGTNPVWTCSNPNGDVCFTFSDPISGGTNRYRTLTIHFTPGTFTTTGDPDTIDFLRFGASVNRLKPANPAGNNNDGDAVGILNVPVSITFYNSGTGGTATADGVFEDIDKDGVGGNDDGWSEANISGAGGGIPAVAAQAIVPVPNLLSNVFCIGRGPHWVSAKVIAKYDCETGRTKLVRVDRFICPGPSP